MIVFTTFLSSFSLNKATPTTSIWFDPFLMNKHLKKFYLPMSLYQSFVNVINCAIHEGAFKSVD